MEKYTVVDNVILDFSGIHPKLMTHPFPLDQYLTFSRSLSLSLSLFTHYFSVFSVRYKSNTFTKVITISSTVLPYWYSWFLRKNCNGTCHYSKLNFSIISWRDIRLLKLQFCFFETIYGLILIRIMLKTLCTGFFQ